jgi:hypothetical protein
VTASRVGSLSASTGVLLIRFGLCYQGTGPITRMASRHNEGDVGLDSRGRSVFTAAESVEPGAGTFTVGFCVSLLPFVATETILAQSVIGWILVTN